MAWECPWGSYENILGDCSSCADLCRPLTMKECELKCPDYYKENFEKPDTTPSGTTTPMTTSSIWPTLVVPIKQEAFCPQTLLISLICVLLVVIVVLLYLYCTRPGQEARLWMSQKWKERFKTGRNVPPRTFSGGTRIGSAGSQRLSEVAGGVSALNTSERDELVDQTRSYRRPRIPPVNYMPTFPNSSLTSEENSGLLGGEQIQVLVDVHSENNGDNNVGTGDIIEEEEEEEEASVEETVDTLEDINQLLPPQNNSDEETQVKKVHCDETDEACVQVEAGCAIMEEETRPVKGEQKAMTSRHQGSVDSLQPIVDYGPIMQAVSLSGRHVMAVSGGEFSQPEVVQENGTQPKLQVPDVKS